MLFLLGSDIATFYFMWMEISFIRPLVWTRIFYNQRPKKFETHPCWLVWTKPSGVIMETIRQLLARLHDECCNQWKKKRPVIFIPSTLSHSWIIHLEHHYISLSALPKCLLSHQAEAVKMSENSPECLLQCSRAQTCLKCTKKNPLQTTAGSTLTQHIFTLNVYMLLNVHVCGHLLRWSSCTSGCSLSLWSRRTWARPARPAGSSSAPVWWCWRSEGAEPTAPEFPKHQIRHTHTG